MNYDYLNKGGDENLKLIQEIRELEHREELFRTAVEKYTDSFAIFSAVRSPAGEIVDFRYEYINEAGCRLNRRSQEEQVGKTVLELRPRLAGSVLFQKYRQVVETGEPLVIEGLDFDQVFKEGEPRGRIYDIRAVKVDDGIAVTWRDVTRSRLSEKALQQAHRQTVEILESITDAFYSLDRDWRFTYVNQRAVSLWNIPAAKLLGKSIWDVFPSGKGTESYQKMNQAMASQEPDSFEIYSSFLDQWVAVRLYPTEQGISVYFLDITAQKRYEETMEEYARQLERSNRELQEFAYVASHDLQEPLRKVSMFGSDLYEKLKNKLTEQEDDRFSRLLKATARMQGMIKDLLELSQVSTKGEAFEPVELGKVAENVISDLDARIGQTNARVEVEELPPVMADQGQIERLLMNLLSNAIKYQRPDVSPHIRLTGKKIHKDGREFVEIQVEDNGIGFDRKDSERIFQPFQRLNGSRRYDGNGMGLAICKRIVERHGGSISATGDPDNGSTFTVQLPVKQRMVGERKLEGIT